MMLDLIDAAFVGRWHEAAPPTPPAAPPHMPVEHRASVEHRPPVELCRAVQPDPAARHAAAPSNLPRWRPPTPAAVAAVPRDLVGRLLDQAADEWAALAAHVEAARRRGRRVIAVAGSEPREGRSTLVACLALTLEARGGDVVCIDQHDVAAATAGGHGPCHDRRVVLVDAGIWFPPGPIRRQHLLVASLGCEAVILVARGQGRSAARAAALEAIGIEVLGEVLTFTATRELPRS